VTINPKTDILKEEKKIAHKEVEMGGVRIMVKQTLTNYLNGSIKL
jgi:hypothetical protein